MSRRWTSAQYKNEEARRRSTTKSVDKKASDGQPRSLVEAQAAEVDDEPTVDTLSEARPASGGTCLTETMTNAGQAGSSAPSSICTASFVRTASSVD